MQKKPHIAVLAIVAPARLIGVLDRRLTVLLNQPVQDRFQPGGQIMHGPQEAAAVQPQLPCQTAHRGAMDIVLLGHVGQKPVAEQPLGKDARGPSREHPVTSGAIPLLQFVNHDLLLDRHHLNDGTPLKSLGTESSATIRTLLGAEHPLGPGDFLGLRLAAATAGMTGFGPALLLLVILQAVGLDDQLGRGGGRAEGSFLGIAFLIAQTVFEPGVLLLEPVNLLLFAQAVAAVLKAVQAHAGCGRCWRWARSKSGPRAKSSCSRRRPFWRPRRKSGTRSLGTYIQRRRLPSVKEKIQEGCLSPRAQAGQCLRMQGFLTRAREPLSGGQRLGS